MKLPDVEPAGIDIDDAGKVADVELDVRVTVVAVACFALSVTVPVDE